MGIRGCDEQRKKQKREARGLDVSLGCEKWDGRRDIKRSKINVDQMTLTKKTKNQKDENVSFMPAE